MSASSPLAVAIVGAGQMGRWHRRAIGGAGGRVAGVVDLDPDRARALDPKAAAFASVQELLSSVRPDVVHVCTPIGAHVEVVTAALAAGVHVVVEKPVAVDAEATRSLVEAAAAAARVLVPVHQFVFQPGVTRLMERRAALGRLVRCSFVAASAGAEKTGLDPDELVAEILPHPLSLFARVTTTDLGGLSWQVVAPARGELRALAAAEGVSLEIAITSNGRPTRTELELIGTEGTGHADLFHGFSIVDVGRATRGSKLARPFTRSTRIVGSATANVLRRAIGGETAYPGLAELVKRTYDAIAIGTAPPISPDETLAVAAARDRILAELGRAE